MVVDSQLIERRRSYAPAWSIALACIPTAIVATLIACLLLPSGAGEGELVAAALAFMIALGGGLIVLICSIVGVILAIVHSRRTKSNLAWIGIPLNLLEHGADPNVVDGKRHTALYWLMNRQGTADDPNAPVILAIKKMFVERDAKLGPFDVGVVGGGGNIPLLKEYLDTGGDAYQALRNAARTGQIETAKYLLDKGVDINGNPDRFRRLSGTPLTMAAYAGQIKMVRFLL